MHQSIPHLPIGQRTRTFLRTRFVPIALATLPCVASPLVAQDTAAALHRTSLQEFGIDAGMTIGLGSLSSVQLTLPAARARIGFFLPQNSHWSIEPAGFVSYEAVKDTRGSLLYDVEFGALYHMRPTGDLAKGTIAVPYIRPFIGVDGVAGGGGSTGDFRAGAGLGIKIPWREMIAWRLEANAGYGFHTNAFQLGAFAGVSVFTHHRVL